MFAFTTSVYFLAYAPMQLVNGLLVDRWGPRRAQSALFLIGGFGAIIFGIAKGPTLLIIGRLLLGAGMAGGLMTAFAANRIWFNKEDLTLVNSLSFAIGSLGAIVSSYPTYLLLEVMSWQSIMISLACLNFLLMTIILFFVPDPEKIKSSGTWGEEFRELKEIYTDRVFWKIAPLTALICGVGTSFQSYWVSPWIVSVEMKSYTYVALILLAIAIALVVSNPFAVLIKTFLEKFKLQGVLVLPICATLAIVSQVLIVMQIFPASSFLWFLYTVFSASLMLAYGYISAHFPVKLAGRSVTALNVLLIQKSVGYSVAFWIFIVLQLISLIWYSFGKYKPYGKR